MTQFQKYSSIENSYREKTIHHMRMQVPQDAKWVAMEKIHGANFSIWVHNDRALNVQAAKRSGFIPEGENFYGHDAIMERHTKAVKDIAKEHFDGYEGPDIAAVAVFGEICGGSGDGVQQVQSGVFYSHDKQFIVFDIMVQYKNGENVFLSVLDVMMATSIHGLHMAPILEQGSLDTCLAIDPHFPSLVPGMLGEEPPNENIAEGLVIKPMRDVTLSNGSRAILKQKNEKFSEKKAKVKKAPVELSEEASRILDEFAGYLVNENRVAAVISKEGEVDHRQTGKIIGMVTKDAIEDYMKDTDTDPSKVIDKAEWKKIIKSLTPQLAQLILKEV